MNDIELYSKSIFSRKINEKFRYRLIIKCRNSKRFRELISEILIKTSTDSRFSGVTVYADINPDSTV